MDDILLERLSRTRLDAAKRDSAIDTALPDHVRFLYEQHLVDRLLRWPWLTALVRVDLHRTKSAQPFPRAKQAWARDSEAKIGRAHV